MYSGLISTVPPYSKHLSTNLQLSTSGDLLNRHNFKHALHFLAELDAFGDLVAFDYLMYSCIIFLLMY